MHVPKKCDDYEILSVDVKNIHTLFWSQAPRARAYCDGNFTWLEISWTISLVRISEFIESRNENEVAEATIAIQLPRTNLGIFFNSMSNAGIRDRRTQPTTISFVCLSFERLFWVLKPRRWHNIPHTSLIATRTTTHTHIHTFFSSSFKLFQRLVKECHSCLSTSIFTWILWVFGDAETQFIWLVRLVWCGFTTLICCVGGAIWRFVCFVSVVNIQSLMFNSTMMISLYSWWC